MKILSIALFLLIPLTSFAEVISFKCKSVDVTGVHKFDAHGVVKVYEDNRVEGVISIQTQKAQSAQSMKIFEDVRIDGFIRHFKAGELVENAFDQLVVSTDGPYLKSLNLLLDFPNRLASKVNSIDNFIYRSNCKITETVY